MTRRASTTLIGAFVVGGLLVVAAAIIAVAGHEFFERKQRAVMHFRNSVYGLQVGAPVVFRGVRIGSVRSIGIDFDRRTGEYTIPVWADLEEDSLRGLGGRDGAPARLPMLVERGLRAQLSMQSLLTGQLYVDLDMRPQQPASYRGGVRNEVEIPTTSTAIQNLKTQLDGIDFRRLVDDVSAIAASARALVSGPQLKQALDDVAQITANVKRLTARLDNRVDPLTKDLGGALQSTRRAMEKLGTAADGMSSTAATLKGTGERASALLAPDSPLVGELKTAAQQLALAAQGLRRATSEDSELMRRAGHALEDVSRTARSLNELVELLDRHPDALLRGRRAVAGGG